MASDTSLPTLYDHITSESKQQQASLSRWARLSKQPSTASIHSDRESPDNRHSDTSPIDGDDEPNADIATVPATKAPLDLSVHVEECVVRLHTFSNYQWSLADDRLPEAPPTGARHRRAPHGSLDGIQAAALASSMDTSRASLAPPLPAVVELCELCFAGLDVEVRACLLFYASRFPTELHIVFAVSYTDWRPH